ncbi:hypothetical protein DdX_21613 [Ditylenchus destructor]|uniref:Uncharacterized protein n=1 Tax=Ditylenchus destructor TaxID=166010 RepID=A0AAD4MG66_9BILA|nr:hypothetical protein DdX_21613 [Ditylenchus destructor]
MRSQHEVDVRLALGQVEPVPHLHHRTSRVRRHELHAAAAQPQHIRTRHAPGAQAKFRIRRSQTQRLQLLEGRAPGEGARRSVEAARDAVGVQPVHAVSSPA